MHTHAIGTTDHDNRTHAITLHRNDSAPRNLDFRASTLATTVNCFPYRVAIPRQVVMVQYPPGIDNRVSPVGLHANWKWGVTAATVKAVDLESRTWVTAESGQEVLVLKASVWARRRIGTSEGSQ